MDGGRNLMVFSCSSLQVDEFPLGYQNRNTTTSTTTTSTCEGETDVSRILTKQVRMQVKKEIRRREDTENMTRKIDVKQKCYACLGDNPGLESQRSCRHLNDDEQQINYPMENPFKLCRDMNCLRFINEKELIVIVHKYILVVASEKKK